MLPEDGPPVLKFTTVFNTSTTNLLTSSYIHLKDLLDSRRSSRASVTIIRYVIMIMIIIITMTFIRPDNMEPGSHLTPGPGPREVRSCSLGNSSNTLLLPQNGQLSRR